MRDEAADYVFHLTTGCGLLVLIILYTFGVWIRSVVLPSGRHLPLRRQLLGSIPVGFVTMGLYAKSAFPALSLSSSSLTFDVLVMAGYTIFFGMISREALERFLSNPQTPGIGLPMIGGTPPGPLAGPAAPPQP